jgi:hypothetical protein
MDADGESLDVGVSVAEHREQRSPLSCDENTSFPPGSSEPQTPVMPLGGSPVESDVGVRAMEYRIRHNLKKDSFSVVEGRGVLSYER